MRARLTPQRAGRIVANLAWALATGLVIDFAAMIILFGTGP
jgi:hypothetical protein